MAKLNSANSNMKGYQTFRRYMSALSLICVFLVIICGLDAGVSVAGITTRAMIVLLCIFGVEVVLIKTWFALQMAKEPRVSRKK